MRLAMIDCGTNTVLLLVADVHPGQRPTAVEERIEITRLGEGLDRSGVLKEEAMQRTLSALQQHAQAARALGAERLVAVGTESLRAARNGADFLSRAAAAGLPLRVVSGDEEARLSWQAVAGSLPLAEGAQRSVLDIGGGSTELIVGQGGPPGAPARPSEFRSVPIGSVRLTERLLHHDPPTPGETQALIETIDQAIAALPQQAGELCAVAGTVTTLAAISLGMDPYDPLRIEGLRLPLDTLSELVSSLGAMPLGARRGLRGLDPRRADVIYAGAMILLRVALRAGVAEVVISDRGVRWGILEDLRVTHEGATT